MGIHYVNGSLVGDGKWRRDTPEIVLYEPLANGRLRLPAPMSGPQAEWDSTTEHKGPPELMDSSFICLTAPIASGSKRSTRCTSGPGRTIPTAHSRTGTPTFRATVLGQQQ